MAKTDEIMQLRAVTNPVAAPPLKVGEIMEVRKRERVSFVLKQSCYDMAKRLMEASGINNEQVFFVELLKKYYKFGPAKHDYPAENLHIFNFRSDEKNVSCWTKPLVEEVQMLKQLCSYHGFVRTSALEGRPYRYSRFFTAAISHSTYLLEKREKRKEKAEENNSNKQSQVNFRDPIASALAVDDFPEDVIDDDFFK